MTKEIIEKIANSYTPLQTNDLSVEDKKALYAVLAKKGFTLATFHLRFFQKGFSEWEIEGTNEYKRQFLLLSDVSQLLLDYVDKDDLQMVNAIRDIYIPWRRATSQDYSILAESTRTLACATSSLLT